MTKTNSDGIFNVSKIRNFNIVELLLVTRDGDDRCRFMIRFFFNYHNFQTIYVNKKRILGNRIRTIIRRTKISLQFTHISSNGKWGYKILTQKKKYICF